MTKQYFLLWHWYSDWFIFIFRLVSDQLVYSGLYFHTNIFTANETVPMLSRFSQQNTKSQEQDEWEQMFVNTVRKLKMRCRTLSLPYQQLASDSHYTELLRGLTQCDASLDTLTYFCWETPLKMIGLYILIHAGNPGKLAILYIYIYTIK